MAWFQLYHAPYLQTTVKPLTSNVFCAIDMICKTPFIPVKNLPKNNLVKCANKPTAAFESGKLDIKPEPIE
ncbi:MAG: hypothetical protein LC768_08725 [Acidobacteria bacterium]|nr:hypothetical protein [Acidobacteriota bacterium]MCA1638402.1 hypothetical protein [Acidobacteriota bacterium]